MDGRVGRAEVKLMEEPMKSLSELANIYEKRATENEARAEEILAAQDSYAFEVREQQLWRASHLKAEAAALKTRATELRDLDGGMVEIVQDGYKVPQHRDQGCDRPRTIWRYNRFR